MPARKIGIMLMIGPVDSTPSSSAPCPCLAVLDEPGAVAEISDLLRVDFLHGAEEAAYRELTAPDAWIHYPDTAPVLRALRRRGLRIGIVSDFAWDLRTHLAHLAHHGLDALIDTCVVSYEQGREKPDPPAVPQSLRRPPRRAHGRRQPGPRRRRHRLWPAHLHPPSGTPHG
ncbi:HAD family hydrolase [Streptomyces sp. NPDC096132]|uniref:HAD family hydrolase n=1 Tax=Streptomyces sp. NPDC096132 TaxID=3366075 RepID=UPI00380E9F82